MRLYTFVFMSPYKTSIKQIASDMDEETVRRTYFNSMWSCVSSFKLDPSEPINKNVYLYELEIDDSTYEG